MTIEPPRPKQTKIVPKPSKHRFTICVSGAARGDTVEDDYKLAFELGKQVAKQGHALITGATIGLPDWAAQGAKSAGGMSVGISPASSAIEHLKKYRLPTASYDFILYTGLNYVGRDALLVQSADALLSIGGRMGTVHEFATAIEAHVPVGVLKDSGGTSAEFEHLMTAAGLCHDGICDGRHDVLFSDKPSLLVERIVTLLEERNNKTNVKKDDNC
jgi:uncharacterized protein (TIGR00725 family)